MSSENLFPAQRTTKKTIVLVGKMQTGKSCFKEVIIDPEKLFEMGVYAHTEKPSVEHIAITDPDGKIHVLEFLDTPGLFELRTKKDETRSNEKILEIIKWCVKNDVTTVDVILFVIRRDSALTQEDVNTFKKYMDFFGKAASQNSGLLITHVDDLSDKQIEAFVQKFKQGESTKDIIKYCKLGTFFSGAVSKEAINSKPDHLKKPLKKHLFHCVQKRRQAFLAKILGLNKKPIKPKAFAALQEKVVHEKLQKDGCKIL